MYSIDIKCRKIGVPLEIMKHDSYSNFIHGIRTSLMAGVLYEVIEDKINLSYKRFKNTALVHDTGKIFILSYSNSPKSFSPQEKGVTKLHTTLGYNYLSYYFGKSHPFSITALTHHEKNNGSGYPLGLEGPEINPYAVYVSLIDDIDARTTPRIYRPKVLSLDKVVVDIIEHNGEWIDEELLNIFLDGFKVHSIENGIGDIILSSKKKSNRF